MLYPAQFPCGVSRRSTPVYATTTQRMATHHHHQTHQIYCAMYTHPDKQHLGKIQGWSSAVQLSHMADVTMCSCTAPAALLAPTQAPPAPWHCTGPPRSALSVRAHQPPRYDCRWRAPAFGAAGLACCAGGWPISSISLRLLRSIYEQRACTQLSERQTLPTHSTCISA